MLTNATIDRLRHLKLFGMLKEIELQLQTPQYLELSFEERLGLAIDREVTERSNRRYERRIRDAKLKEKAMIEDIDWDEKRRLDKGQIMSLASCGWAREHQNIIFTGKTGSGKTWLSCALAQRACLEGFAVYFARVRRLFDQLATARLDGTFAKIMAQLARFDILVLDDWGQKLSETERRDLLEVVEDKMGTGSLIISSQLPVNRWHEVIGDPTQADALLDRIVHRAHKIPLDGDSLRKKYQITNKKDCGYDAAVEK